MSLESRNKTPSDVAIHYLNLDKLQRLYPHLFTDDSCIDNLRSDTDSLVGFIRQTETDYDPELAKRAFGPMIDTIKQRINPLVGSKILEIGGSTGLLSRYLQDCGANITMLEVDKNSVNIAQQRGVNAKFYNGTDLLGSVPYGEKYDAIIATRVLEGIIMPEEQAGRLAKQINLLLNPQGSLIVGTQSERAVWHNAIIRGSQLKLISTEFFINHNYIRHVFVYGNPFITS